MTIAVQRVAGQVTGRVEASAQPDRSRIGGLLRNVACASVLTGLVHAGLCPSHFRESTLFGLFFAAVAVLQLLWAATVLAFPRSWLLIAGAAGDLIAVGIWVVSRTVGVPFGPTAWQPERIGMTDSFTAAVEVAVAIGAVCLVVHRMGRSQTNDLRVNGRKAVRKVRDVLPRGSILPDEVWAQRHRWIVAVLWLHAPGVFVFALARHRSLLAGMVQALVVVAFGVAVRRSRDHRRISTVITSLGLLTCSALLVRLSGGAIEMHFHYFVMVGVITLYQDWWPFLVAIGYVVLQHGLAGALEPRAVYDHQSAVNHPWEWAGIHGLFILGMSSAGIASWRLNESFLTGVIERQEQLEEAQEVARLGGWERDLTTGETSWSAEFYRLLGLDPHSAVADRETFYRCVHPEDRAAVEAGLAATWAEGAPYQADFRITRADGVRWLHCRARVSEHVDGRPSAMVGTIQEITDRKEAEHTAYQTLSLLEATLDATADGILVVDSSGKITSSNRRFAELWHLPPAVLATGDDDAALAFVVGQLSDPESFLAKVRDLYTQPDAESQDVIEFRDGRIFERFSTPQRVGGVAVGRVWSFRDITDQRRLERDLSHQAFHDSLTNLANQALFRDRVDHALVRCARTTSAVAVLFLDLDNFKTVNDSLGHAAGDQLLVAVADRLRACLRATDTAARLGGDEFAVLVEDVSDEREVVEAAERLTAALQQPFVPGGREIFVSASIGIAFGRPGSDSDQLLRNGDLAMYTAKRRGKACFEIYRPEMHDSAVERLEMEADLRRAITGEQLRVHYQPIFRLNTGEMVGAEALVRWMHPQKGLLSPDLFIPLAEETGLIRELGRQVLMEACSQARGWQLRHPGAMHLSVSVNVSPRQLHDDDLMDQVRQALEASGLPAGSLVLEITETAMMHDIETTLRRLEALKSLGIRLAIDDFGTGYSSLSYIHRFPVDILKIDRTFVSELKPQNQESSLALAIVSLAGMLGLSAVAEGVETPAQAEALRNLGCPLVQGFHFSRPVTAEAFGALLGPAVGPDVPIPA